MKRLFTRSQSLLLVAALAMVAAMCAVVPAHAASSVGGVRMSAAASHDLAASSTPCDFTLTLSTCESTDPAVAYSIDATGVTSSCSFVVNVTWGDGGSTTKTVTDPTPGYHLLANHTYAAPNVYTITITIQVTAGNCTGTNSVHTFTLLAPPLPPLAPSSSTVYLNYAGYSAGPLAGTVLYVQANWTVPTVVCGAAPGKNFTGRAAAWVGMWGPETVGTPDWLWQAGTNSQCTKQTTKSGIKQTTQYYAWYELVPKDGSGGPHILKMTVHAGDKIFAQVYYAGEDHGQLKLWYDVTDQTSGVQKENFVDAPKGVSLPDISGQGAVEVEWLNGKIPNFTPITFSNIAIGASFSSQAKLTQYQMGQHSCPLGICFDKLLAISGPLSNSSFTVKWNKRYTL